ncbi:unnamed protein product [Closterium sp. NIES-54]
MIPIHVIIWQIMAEKGKAADAKAEAQVLQHQIAHSPKKLEMALKRVEEAIQAETEAKKEEANSAEVFRHKLLMSRDVLEVIKRRNETIQPALSTHGVFGSVARAFKTPWRAHCPSPWVS